MKEFVNKIESYPIERYTIKENVNKIELKRKKQEISSCVWKRILGIV